MASSGTATSWISTYEDIQGGGAYYNFEWISTKTSPGVTTISWKLYGKGRTSTPRWLQNICYIDIINNGTTTRIYTLEWDGNQSFEDGTNTSFNASSDKSFRDSGTFTINHDSSGEASFDIQIQFTAYSSSPLHTTITNVILDTNIPYYTLTYNANGGAGAPAAQNLIPNVETAISTTEPTRNGYAFRGWNTNGSGYGTWYQPGGNITITSDTTLYAIWGHRYYVAYNGNGATGGSVSNTTHYYNVASSLAINTYTRSYTVTYNGNGGTPSAASATATYAAIGWNTNSSGTGANYNNGQNVYTLNATKDAVTTLYAKWDGGSITLPTATRPGYRFAGWNTNSAGTGTSYAGGATYTPTANTTLYAQWTQVSGTQANAIYIKINNAWHLSTHN